MKDGEWTGADLTRKRYRFDLLRKCAVINNNQSYNKIFISKNLKRISFSALCSLFYVLNC